LIIPQILDLRGRSLFAASAADFLRRLVIVAAHVHADRGRDCVTSLEAALASQKPVSFRWHWEYYDMDLPAPCNLTFAATLIPAATDPRFCQAIFALKPEAEAVGLLSRIIETGIRDERDRVATIWTLKTKDVVLNIARGTGLAEAVRICLEMARRHDWPDTEAGRKLQCCWLYGAIRLLFESSRTAFEASDLEVAVKQAGRAIQLAVDSLPQIAHDNPLFKCYVEDEDGVFESMGDFFHRQPNIVTEANSSDYFPVSLNSFPFPGRENECWHDFAKWSDAGHAAGKPVLLAYGLWLSAEHGQGAALLPICEALAATLGTLKKPGD
jgi:hypothetical protein